MPRRTPRQFAFLSALLLTVALQGCGGPRISAPEGQNATPFRPPTLAAPTLPPETPTAPPAARATSKSNCSDLLTFITDVTIPDGTQVVPSSTLDKRWEVENSGTCNWDERYKIRLTSGSEMGAAKEQTLFPARSGSRAVLRIVFTAPDQPGKYRSSWQAFNPDGQPFGDPFFVEIVVTNVYPTIIITPTPTTTGIP